MPKAAKRWKQKGQDAIRLNSYQRGYDKEWFALSKRFKEAHPFCVDCQQAGRVRPSEEVHHIQKAATHPHMRLDWHNLMALCKVCHAIRTQHGE